MNKIKNIFTRIKIKAKSNLLLKIAELKKENKLLKEKLIGSILLERQYIDKINDLKREIRSLKLGNKNEL